ncbi:hypothetical protein AZH53_09665 [Methanomicrobiaceae archaeon CYW5]|uniref:hypothetical protein n=1 Tax=Methanovulcanius yangii TaxID=1789227 RepID=UPI0029CA9300|nr:hypothetical protein [Methanovulcanius yangii]MBT8508671.1 hypothetical protein [Methanovulcanius yangii]
MHSRTISSLASALLIVTCAVTCGCVAPEDEPVAVNTTVPVERGWNQAAVALLETYVLGGAGQEPYERFNGSVVSPDPLILPDSDGHPLYYRYFVQKDGEIFYAVQVSANKLLGKTVTQIGDFGYLGRNASTNLVNGSDPSGGKSPTAYGTPVPSYDEEYTHLMLDCWDVEDTYAQNVVRNAENAGINLSRPLSGDDQELIREILWENIRLREERMREVEDKHHVEL